MTGNKQEVNGTTTALSSEPAPTAHDDDFENFWSLLTLAGLNKRLANIIGTARNPEVSTMAESFESDVAGKANIQNKTRILDLTEMSCRVSLLNQYNLTGNKTAWNELLQRL